MINEAEKEEEEGLPIEATSRYSRPASLLLDEKLPQTLPQLPPASICARVYVSVYVARCTRREKLILQYSGIPTYLPPLPPPPTPRPRESKTTTEAQQPQPQQEGSLFVCFLDPSCWLRVRAPPRFSFRCKLLGRGLGKGGLRRLLK